MNIFENIGIAYDELRIAHQIVVDSLMAVVKERNFNLKILDVGCGSGKYAECIAVSSGIEVHCIDSSRNLLNVAKNKNGLITNLVDCNKALPFPDDQFGLTYNVNFIHFIVDIQQFYAEQYRILENKGIVFTATHSEQDFKSQSMGYYFPESIKIEMNKTPSIKEIIEAMRTVGFKDIRINTITDSLSIDPLFLNACQAKVFSCLHEISELSYSKGVKKIEQDMAKGVKGSVNYSIIRGEK